MSQSDRRNCVVVICLFAALSAVYAQGGGVTWGGGQNAGAGAGAWSNAQQGGPGMHPPGSLVGQDPQISYGYGGVDSRGNTYGGAGGNGGYYVSGTDEHGRPFSYNGGVGGQPLPGQPGYPNNYYRSSAGAAVASVGVALVMSVLVSRT
ncbi:hypothetical protein ACLKA7_007047 [Drosophila subpalustris]